MVRRATNHLAIGGWLDQLHKHWYLHDYRPVGRHSGYWNSTTIFHDHAIMNQLFNRKSIVLRRSQSGMTLVEILVALVISLVLLGGVIQIFLGNKITYRVQDNLSQIQENGRYAIDLLNQDIRMANYRGCAGPKAPVRNTLNNSSNYNWNLVGDTSVQGFNATSVGWTPNLDSSITGVRANSDVIAIRGPDTTNSAFVVAQANGTTALRVTPPSDLSLQVNDIVMVADCANIAVFQITAITAGGGNTINLGHTAGSGNPGNTTANLINTFVGGEVTQVGTKTYYIGTGASGQPALFRRTATATQELIEGVEDMQVVFGVDSATLCGVGAGNDGAIDCYLSANAINATDWPSVRSVQIRLLLRSLEDNLTPTSQPIAYNGGTVNSGSGADRRLRQAFTTTISLRNQLR